MQAAERIPKLLATMPPTVKAELTILMAMLLQEGVEAVLASQHAGLNIAPMFPVHVSVGIKTASNLDPTPKKGFTHGIIHVHKIAKSRLQKIKEGK
jgi:hypothetical protein